MSTQIVDEAQVRALIDRAERAQVQGQFAEAKQLLAAARSASPNHPAILSACAVLALHSGNASEARTALEQAIRVDSKNPVLLLNLATVLRTLNEPEAEMAALHSALGLDPYFSGAIFQKASLLEKQSKGKQAAMTYHAALASLRPGDQLPASWQPVIEHAQAVVGANFRDLEDWLNSRMREVRERFRDQPQDRANDCLAALLGKKRIYVQQPLFTHFPRLPAIEFFEPTDFPWLATAQSATEAMRSEALQLLQGSLDDFSPYLTHSPDTPLHQWKELNQSRRWTAYFLHKDGQRIEDHIARCPKTAAMLENVPTIKIPHRGPTAFFSLLEPKTRIPPHTGSTNTRLTVHIPLIVPPQCGFRVGSTVREWQPGTALIFDDTIEHEAWNDSDEPRVILIFDIWNPLLSQAERELMTVAAQSIAEFYEEGASSVPA